MEQAAIDEEEAYPRFLLGAEPTRADVVAAVLEALRPAGLLLRLNVTFDEGGDVVGDFRRIVAAAGVAFFVEDDVDLALRAAADGVQLKAGSDVKSARERLNQDQLIGAAAGLSRHDAMTAGESGADYITFGDQTGPLTDEIIEVVQWWRATTVLPCLAYAANAEEIARLAGIGTDFIGVASAIWDHPDGPVAAAHLMQQAVKAG